MPPANLLLDGVEIMLYGMGFVFAFLVLLIYSIRAMSALIARFVPEPVAVAPVARPRPATPGAATDPKLLSAIQAAIHQHRAKRR